MSVVDQEISDLAQLARLNLTPEEKEEMGEDLKEILEFAEKINEVDTEGIEPTYHALPLTNVFREDEERPSPSPASALENSAASVDGYFVVPQVIEE